MSAKPTPERLSQISTMWTALAQAHGAEKDADRQLLAGLIERYQDSAYRYLTAATGDPEVAMDLFQEFAIRFLRGDFRRASPDRGRFRDYLRTVLINLVRRRPGIIAQQPSAGVDPDQLPAAANDSIESDESFLAHWRESLLDRAWAALAAAERVGGPPYHSALRARSEQPDIPSDKLAALLSERLKTATPYTDAAVRKLLQRAREILTDSLVSEVAASIPTREREPLTQELIDLGFHGYCRKALERWPG